MQGERHAGGALMAERGSGSVLLNHGASVHLPRSLSLPLCNHGLLPTEHPNSLVPANRQEAGPTPRLLCQGTWAEQARSWG